MMSKCRTWRVWLDKTLTPKDRCVPVPRMVQSIPRSWSKIQGRKERSYAGWEYKWIFQLHLFTTILYLCTYYVFVFFRISIEKYIHSTLSIVSIPKWFRRESLWPEVGWCQVPDGESSGHTFSIPRCADHRAVKKQSKDESYTCRQFLCDEFVPSDQVFPVVPDPTTRPSYNGKKDAEQESNVLILNSDKIKTSMF